MARGNKFVYNADGVDFTIYETVKATQSGQKAYWLLVDHSSGRRRVLSNPSRKAAEVRADKIRAAMVKGQASRMTLSNGKWQDVCMAVEILRSAQTCESLTSAIRDWTLCGALLGSRATVLDAVKFYLASHEGRSEPVKPIEFKEAAQSYHEFKVGDKKSAAHCKNIIHRLNRLAQHLEPETLLTDLTAGRLEQVVQKFELSPKTRNEYRFVLSNLYAWAARQSPPLVPRGFNPGKEMERCSVKQDEVSFLHVADLKKILSAISAQRPHLLPLVTVVCFAGLRPSEAARLDWSEVGEDYIRLPGIKSKTGFSRQIPIQPNLKLWLAEWRKNTGFVCGGVNIDHVNMTIKRVSGVSLTHDGMRHGYGTHRQRIVKSIGTVSEEMGNAPAICKRHYVNAFCSDAEATEWFSLLPESSPTVVEPVEVDESLIPAVVG